MVDRPKIRAKRLSAKVLLVFTAAFLFQGASLAVFHGDRPASKRVVRMERPVLTGNALALPLVLTVTSVLDEGDGSLREAIEKANANPGRDQIRFAFSSPVTLTLSSPLRITDPVDIEGPGPWITDVGLSYVTVDGTNLPGNLLVVSNVITKTLGTSIRGLRLANVQKGYGFVVSGLPGGTGTEFIGNTVINSLGGFLLTSTGHITVTRNALIDLGDVAVHAENADDLWLNRNWVQNIGSTAFHLSDGVERALIFSNSISGVFEEFGSAIVVAGDPAPTGVVMRSNHFTDTYLPIFLGPGANFGFPAPEILKAYYPISATNTVQFSASSPADPFSYTYPLAFDIYRVRDGNYSPLGPSVMYQASDFPDAVTYTFPDGNLKPTDFLVVIATTFNPNSSEFSNLAPLLPPPDSDDDGVADPVDECPGTVIPESDVPSASLGVNRFALVDGDQLFDTRLPEGQGPERTYTTTETVGCSCEQIIEELDLGQGQKRHGCSISVMDEWVAQVNAASKTEGARSDVRPESYVLEQNYPNPFNPTTKITYQVPERHHVVLRVFDMLGREVTTLVNKELEGGTYQVDWDGRNAQGLPVSSGVYIYRIEAGDYTHAKTMILHR